VTDRSAAARKAYDLSLSQLARLRANDVDAYLAAEDELAGVYREMLIGVGPEPGEFAHDELEATTRELVGVQQVICGELDRLLDRTAEALSAQRRRRAVTGAYGVVLPEQRERGA